jgi:hypothetical protein
LEWLIQRGVMFSVALKFESVLNDFASMVAVACLQDLL